jgi:hypothetical protein
MLLPRTHAWTSLQKWLIVSSIVVGVAAFSIAVYSYERYHRGPSDDALVGRWRFPPLGGGDMYFRLSPDHTFRVFSDEVAEKDSPLQGTWFGGGSFVYFIQPVFDRDGFPTDHPLYIWRLEGMSPNELHVRLNPDGVPRLVRRVSADSADASNQPLQPPAGLSDE